MTTVRTNASPNSETRLSVWVTIVFGVSAVLGVAFSAFRWPAFVVAIGLFVYGFVLLVLALVIGAGRSRTEAVEIFGLFFTEAPMKLRLLFLAQVVIAFVTAAIETDRRVRRARAYRWARPVRALTARAMEASRAEPNPRRSGGCLPHLRDVVSRARGHRRLLPAPRVEVRGRRPKTAPGG